MMDVKMAWVVERGIYKSEDPPSIWGGATLSGGSGSVGENS
jgi:hypothetical protein